MIDITFADHLFATVRHPKATPRTPARTCNGPRHDRKHHHQRAPAHNHPIGLLERRGMHDGE
ncbi:hypothetical protein ACIPSA_46450 [Streptomyces sp. NPDC086549]|uniref:hypothetical protein n=1 Tax=Streptomyces sp. NPDC086549 TaxID=3365752 RepID=UPI0037FA7FAC